MALNRSQFVTGSQKHRDPRFPPLAFTEHGAIMAATVLNSPRAVEMSVYVVRAFVQLRELLASNTVLARKLNEFEGNHRIYTLRRNGKAATSAALNGYDRIRQNCACQRRPHARLRHHRNQ
jgi:hypothetical protein